MRIIDSEEIIKNLLSENKVDRITFKELNSIRNRIESENKDVYVDVTYVSIRKFAIKYINSVEINDFDIEIKNIDEILKDDNYNISESILNCI